MLRRDADRNLLFGINALQNDFITRDALIAAMNAWALEKHRPLEDILVERNALNPDDRDLLNQLIDRHLARHGGDPAASLAAMSSVGSVADDLRKEVADPDVLGSIANIPTDSQPDSYATRVSFPSDTAPVPVRFRKLREHASGNLGVVYIARDEELNREVALKEIKEKNADHLHSQAKFLLEAEVTGGLEHPGIVPVYGLGHHLDGRPYYAMRFIRGKSLLDAIKSFHADDSLKNDAGKRLLQLQKLLRRFTDVCNAVAYAHSRGILHRDLKPDNVMVGKYGETLVVDWGLAKALGQSGEKPETITDQDDPLPEASLQPSSGDHIDVTQAGSLVGTPAYMSPEQAAGRLDLLGPASDIYGLGATLYHLIVGRPPIEATTLGDLLTNVRDGKVTRPRSLAPWLDPGLEAICLKAIALKPEARYDSPRSLAEDVDRWVAGEPVTAYPEPWTRRTRRWSRKHRTALATGCALLLGGAVGVRIAERQKIDASIRATLMQAVFLANEARDSNSSSGWEKAIAKALQAEEQVEIEGGSATVRREVNARLEDLRHEQARRQEFLDAQKKDQRVVAELEEARLRQTNVKDGFFDSEAKHEAYFATFRNYGIDVGKMPVEEVAKRIRSSSVAHVFIAALDDWAAYNPTNVSVNRLRAIARAAEDDPVGIAIRNAIDRRDSSDLRRICENEEDRRKLGFRLRSIVDSLLMIDPTESFPQLEAILRENPSDFWFNHNLGMAHHAAKPPDFRKALRCLYVAVALRPDSPGVHCNLGNVLLNSGDISESIAEFQIAIRIKPDFAEAHLNLGNALKAKGNLDGAIAEYYSAIQMKPSDYKTHFSLGTILSAKGDLSGAIAEHRIAIRIKPDFAETHSNLGTTLLAKGDIEGAIAEYRKAVILNPGDASTQTNLGDALRAQGKIDEAITAYREAIRINPELSGAQYNLGAGLKSKGELDGTIVGFHSISRDENEENKETSRFSYDNSAVKSASSSRTKSEESQRLVFDDSVPKAGSASRVKPEEDVWRHINLGQAHSAQGEFDQAIAEYQTAIRLDSENALAHLNLAKARQGKGEIDAAIAEFRIAIRINPDDAESHTNYGLALQSIGDIDGAIAEYSEAVRINPNFAEAHCNLGLSLQSRGLIAQALEHLELGHELGSNLGRTPSGRPLNPDVSPSTPDPGRSPSGRYIDPSASPSTTPDPGRSPSGRPYSSTGPLAMMGGPTGALAHKGERATWRYPSAQWISECRRLIELEKKLPTILKGVSSPINPDEMLSLSDLTFKKQLYAASARLFGEVFAELPALAEDLRSGNRYNAACSGSLAGSGQGKDEPKPDEAALSKFREQALGWFRADLAGWTKVLDGGSEPARKQSVAKTLAHWQQDTDLTGIRDEAALAKLPEKEREAFRSLWADVEALRKKAETGVPAPPKQ